MTSKGVGTAVLALLAGTAFAAEVAAAPLQPGVPPASGRLILVGGCHGDVQVHYVPEVAGDLSHYHVGGNCRPIAAQGGLPSQIQQDCHRDVRLHFVPGQGEIYHAHRGGSCRVVEYEPHRGAARPGCITIGPVTVCP